VTYQARETSVQDGRPLELYLFESDGGAVRWPYTTGVSAITFSAVTYQPEAISRGEPMREADQLDQGGVVITLPATVDYVSRFVLAVPRTEDTLKIYRTHITDSEFYLFYEGVVSRVSFEGDLAKVAVAPRMTDLAKAIPKRTYRSLCNHILYDARCQAVKATFTDLVTISSVSADGLTIQLTGARDISGDPSFFTGGMLQTVAESRMVLTFTPGNPASATLRTPFLAPPLPGSTMNLVAGCNHLVTTCAARFNNVVNYGGFPYVPTKNPFETGIIND